MTPEVLFRACLAAGRQIVAKERELYPNSATVMAFDVNVGGGTASSEFSRAGTSQQQKQYNLPSALASLIEQGYLNNAVPTSLTTSEQQFLQGLLTMLPEALPNLSVLTGTAGMSPTTFTGSDTLGQISTRNPYSSDWENQTQDLYERQFDIARARTASGPENVRGGQARAGFEMADTNTQASVGRFREIKDQQQKEAGVVTDAITTANAIEQARRGASLHAQNQRMSGEATRRGQIMGGSDVLSRLRASALGYNAMGSEFLSKPSVTTTDNLSGKGNQSTFNWGAGAGLSCCFIFLAAEDGLPWFVRHCRNHLGTDATRRGYRRMAKWLVPLMHRHRWVKVLVQATMTYPITQYGGYLVREPGYETGFVFRAVKRFWFNVWNRLGKD